jgi:iron complex outermembrane recepter protein
MTASTRLRGATPCAGSALTATAAAVLVLFTGSARAQSEPSQTVTVTGIRGAIESAISVKKNSDNIVEAVSAEDIGKLPDTSIAESIARLPGVAAQRTAGRASAISIRGTSPDFSTALLNGREQVSTGDSRFVEFDQYPSELLSGVTIYKTPDAGLIGQGLAGTVDMQTVRPLDYGKRGVAVNYRRMRSNVGVETGVEGDGYRFNIGYIDQFADRTIGIALGFARLSETTGQTTRFESWGSFDEPFNGGTVKTPAGFNSWVDQTKQKRDAAMAVLQWKPNKSFKTMLDVFVSRFEEDRATKGFQAPMHFEAHSTIDPPGTLSNATISNGVAVSGTLDNFKGVVRNDTTSNKDKLYSIGLNNQLAMGAWNGTLDLSSAKARRNGAVLETTAGQPPDATNLDTISWTGFDGVNAGSARFTTGLNYADRSVVRLTDVQGWGGNHPGQEGTAGPVTNLTQDGYSKLPFVEDKLNSLRLSAKRDLPEGGFFSDADFGLNYGDRQKIRSYTEGRLIISATDPAAAATIPGDATMIAGQSGIPIAVFDPNGSIGNIYQLVGKLVPDIANKDWRVNEKLTTLYTKWNIESRFMGLPLRGNAGLQVVHTDQSSVAFNVDGQSCPNDICPTRENVQGDKYWDVLPSVNLVADLGSGNTLRLAVARQMARPVINDMRASLQFSANAQTGLFSGSAGNPELKPFRANAVDLSYEKYFGSKAYFGAAAFYKKLSTYILKVDQQFDFAPYVTASTPLPSSGSTVGTLNRPINGSGGSIRGIELSGSLPLDMVAGWLTGFGVAASYSNTSSSVTLPLTGFVTNNITSIDIPLPGLSRRVASLTAYYERFGFSARIAQRYRSDFLGEITDFTGDRQLTFIKGEKITDLQLGYKFEGGPAKGLSMLFQVNNLNKADFVRYGDTPADEVERTKYGRTYLFGLNYEL